MTSSGPPAYKSRFVDYMPKIFFFFFFWFVYIFKKDIWLFPTISCAGIESVADV